MVPGHSVCIFIPIVQVIDWDFADRFFDRIFGGGGEGGGAHR